MNTRAALRNSLILLVLSLVVSVFGQEDIVPSAEFTSIESSIEFTPLTYYQAVGACEQATFTVDVKNPSTEQEIYDFFVPDFENTSTIVPRAMILNPQESRTVTITTRVPDCTVTGRVPVLFRGETRNSQQILEIELLADVSQKGVPIIAPGISRIVTNYSKTTAHIPVLNPEAEPLTLSVSVQGEAWITPSVKTLQLAPGEQKQLTLVLDPPATATEQTYPATLVLTAGKKEFKKSLDIQLQRIPFAKKLLNTFVKGGGMALAVILALGILFKAYMWYTSPEQKHKRLVTAELRSQERERRKLAEHRETKVAAVPKKAEQKTPALADNDKKKLAQQIEKSLREQYLFVAKHSVVQPARAGWKHIIRIIILVALFALVASGVAIYRTLLLPYVPFIALGAGVLALLWIVSRVLRSRRVSQRFRLVVEGEKAVVHGWHKGITQATLVPRVPVKNLKVLLRKGRAGAPKLPAKAYYATLSANVDAPMSIELHARLPLRWLKSAQLKDVVVWRWTGTEWLDILPDTKKGPLGIEVSATADDIGTFAIGVRPSAKIQPMKAILVKKAKQQTTPGVLGYAALALFFIAAIFLFTTLAPRAEISAAGIPRQSWQQDTDHTLNLSKYFRDPDGDLLTYSATPVQNIKVDIVNTLAGFSPDAGFVGSRDVVFTATDKNNNAVKSNTVKLVVMKSYLPAWAKPYMINVAIGFMILTFIIAVNRFKANIKKFLEG